MNKIDYKKLKKDLLDKVSELGIKSPVAPSESTSETDLLKFAKEYDLNISDYIND
ncbi:hypothetical protein K9O30_12250 [Clostridium bowmanii]|uniref:hypothetical protein n=1 Tax=Clostridium bowmanii TaxID=132925 RepID=UPI001C0E6B32|nr:hypothetical protein [Clostridium bowmanii]MBU3190458.1 hypothetical protein [Clostridium bowmanii]MCA1074480.1 hypothetical protein [Clostridium bowmanii]